VNKPKVTIIMATYNRAHFIVESLQSIQKQIFSDWECLIIDDGGTDNTLEVITPVLENDKRFKYLKRSGSHKKGLPGCRNYGLEIAKGDYIIFFDDDDIVHPQNLELCVQELLKNKVSFCRYLRAVFVDDFNYNFDYSKEYNSFYIDINDIEKMLKNELPFNSCAVMLKKECFEENRFVETLMYAEEWELYSRILSNGYKGISIEKCLFYGRKHPNSNTGEFYNNNHIRRTSKKEAIVLVVQNLKEKQLLSHSLLRYFVQISLNYKEYNLFNQILNSLQLPTFEKIKWQIFYKILPLRLWFFGKWKKIKKGTKK